MLLLLHWSCERKEKNEKEQELWREQRGSERQRKRNKSYWIFLIYLPILTDIIPKSYLNKCHFKHPEYKREYSGVILGIYTGRFRWPKSLISVHIALAHLTTHISIKYAYILPYTHINLYIIYLPLHVYAVWFIHR